MPLRRKTFFSETGAKAIDKVEPVVDNENGESIIGDGPFLAWGVVTAVVVGVDRAGSRGSCWERTATLLYMPFIVF
jgi:hypothetical protein